LGVQNQLVKIILDRDEAQCLLEHADKGSLAWWTLKACITSWIVSGIPAPTITVNCSQEAASRLLLIAEEHCPSAVEKIREALRS
jgi:hypothetical protein